MAAIDKLYVHSYYEYDDLRKWTIAYYPELLFYFYDITLTWSRYAENVKERVEQEEKRIKRDYAKLGHSCSLDEAVENLQKYYKEIVGYDCPKEQAIEEVKYIISSYDKLKNGLLVEEYTFPVMNTPFSVDKKLKWICPVPCVREYLHKQCGVNPKWKWFYKLFWRGKKHFR